MELIKLGWTSYFERSFAKHRADGLVALRIMADLGGLYTVEGEAGTLSARVSGAFRHQARERVEYPAVGDWVLAKSPRVGERDAVIHELLPRRSAFLRKNPGRRTEIQVVAANIDTVMLVLGLDRDFNLRRIERYVALAKQSGATPVVVLNKADLHENVDRYLIQTQSVAQDIPVHVVSAICRTGLAPLMEYASIGKTVALLGSSGTGKSSLINSLLGEDRQIVGVVRERDGRGRHTTTNREILFLPSGGMIVDNPGLRELQAWCDADSLPEGFDDIGALSNACRFRDCTHICEPGCAIQEAVGVGGLSIERFENYLKMRKEAAVLHARIDEKARKDRKAQEKAFSRMKRKMRRYEEN